MVSLQHWLKNSLKKVHSCWSLKCWQHLPNLEGSWGLGIAPDSSVRSCPGPTSLKVSSPWPWSPTKSTHLLALQVKVYSPSFLRFSIIRLSYFIMGVCVCGHMCRSTHMEMRGQLGRVSSLLPPLCRFWESNSGSQACVR